MKVLHVSQWDIHGGAARAAYRLHRGLLSAGVASRMKVRSKHSDDWTVETSTGRVARWLQPLRPLGGYLARLQETENRNLHSCNLVPSRWAKGINGSEAEVVHLHWVAGEALSIADIGRIRKPAVWTLHDMWAFCGAEHVAPDHEKARWRAGYVGGNREPGSGGIDINRWVWERKRRRWKPMRIVVPSRWMAECVQQSALMRTWPVWVIPNLLDVETFRPLDREFSRHVLGLPSREKLILFGAYAATTDRNKGWDLLQAALHQLVKLSSGLSATCVVFGQSEPRHAADLPFPVRWMGHVHDDTTLALLYSAADVMVVPSRMESQSQTATEAHACGCPVVAFNATGLRDVVAHGATGLLARPFDAGELAAGIQEVIGNEQRRMQMSTAARERAVALWRPEVVVAQYLRVYEDAVADASRE